MGPKPTWETPPQNCPTGRCTHPDPLEYSAAAPAFTTMRVISNFRLRNHGEIRAILVDEDDVDVPGGDVLVHVLDELTEEVLHRQGVLPGALTPIHPVISK